MLEQPPAIASGKLSHSACIPSTCCRSPDAIKLNVQRKIYRSLKDLPIRPRVLLPTNGDGLVPSPHVVDKLLVRSLGVVEPGELVRIVVGRYVEGGKRLMAADEEGAFDDGVICLAEDGAGAEEVLAGGFEAGKETA